MVVARTQADGGVDERAQSGRGDERRLGHGRSRGRGRAGPRGGAGGRDVVFFKGKREGFGSGEGEKVGSDHCRTIRLMG